MPKKSEDPRRLAAYGKNSKKPSSDSKDSSPVLSEGLIKTTPDLSGFPLETVGRSGGKPEGESKYRRVAKLLILIGSEEASKILAKLDLEQVEEVTREIATIPSVSDAEAQIILEEFRNLFSSSFGRDGRTSGGIGTARALLHRAFGQDKGEAFLRRAVPEGIENPFGFLEDFSGEQIVLLLKDDSSAALALVLSRLSAKKAAGVLAALDGKRRLEVVRRVASIGKTSPEVLERVAASLREKARKLGSHDIQEVDGKAALAAILKQTDPSFGEELLGDLEEADPDLGRDLKERLYTLEDVEKAMDRPIQEKLRSMNDRDIALLLKGRSPAFIHKIQSNLSQGRRALVEEERVLLGPVPRRDVDLVVREFMAWFRKGREEGRILTQDDDDVV